MARRDSSNSFPFYGSPARELSQETRAAKIQGCRTAYLGCWPPPAIRNRIEKIAFEKNHNQHPWGDFFDPRLRRKNWNTCFQSEVCGYPVWIGNCQADYRFLHAGASYANNSGSGRAVQNDVCC